MENVIQYDLDNGTRVLLMPSAAAPVVACNVWVGVGSADEEPREAGLAHVHEHMLFKGTERRGVGELAREVEAAGGHINAFTSFDQTCYYVVMSSRFFDTGLDILSDAIRNSSFDADELGRELEVIQEEIKRGEDNPSRVASLALFATAFKDHPYKLPVIGTKESVDSFERDDVVRFFEKHYVPSNMTVVLAGDFTEERARELVDQYFADFAGAEHARVERPVEAEQDEIRVRVLDRAARDTHLRIGFHIPALTHEDIPALDLLAAVLGYGEASHLHQTVQRDRELVNGIYAGAYTPKDAGLFMVSADYQLLGEGETGPGPSSHAEVIEAVLEETFRLRDVEVSAGDLRRARTLLESQSVYSKQTVEGLAMKLGQYQMTAGDPNFEAKYYEQLAKVEAKDLRRVARAYVRPENAAIVVSHPKAASAIAPEEVAEAAKRAFEAARRADEPVEVDSGEPAPPKPRRTNSSNKALSLDEHGFARVEIEDGPTLLIQESRAVEVFAVRALGHGGVRAEDERSNGLHSLLTEVATKGSASMSASELAHRIESMASSIAGMSGRNTFGLAMGGLSKFLEPCLDLFAEVALGATIPDDEFERARRLQLQEIRARHEQLGAVNFDRFARAFFGRHPYAMPTGGTLESVEGVSADRARAHWTRLMDPRRLVISVVGDVDAGQVAAKIESLFAKKGAGEPLAIEAPAPPERRQTELVSADLDKNQAHVIVGFNGPLVGTRDRYVLDVINAALSGQGGRLFYELRDRQSLAYSVWASMVLGLEASAYTINIGTSPEKIEQAVRGIGAEVRRLAEEPLSEAEIDGAKRYLVGNHDIGLQRNGSRAMSSALSELYGLGYDRTFRYAKEIESVTRREIGELIERTFDLSRAVVSVTKPEAVDLPDGLLAALQGK